jgi:hypothetical protein
VLVLLQVLAQVKEAEVVRVVKEYTSDTPLQQVSPWATALKQGPTKTGAKVQDDIHNTTQMMVCTTLDPEHGGNDQQPGLRLGIRQSPGDCCSVGTTMLNC